MLTNAEINAMELYGAYVAAATSWPMPYSDLSEAERINWIAFASALGPRASATHVNPATGDLYVVAEPGHEDGTIGAWHDGRWVTAETSGAFESTLVKLNR